MTEDYAPTVEHIEALEAEVERLKAKLDGLVERVLALVDVGFEEEGMALDSEQAAIIAHALRAEIADEAMTESEPLHLKNVNSSEAPMSPE